MRVQPARVLTPGGRQARGWVPAQVKEDRSCSRYCALDRRPGVSRHAPAACGGGSEQATGPGCRKACRSRGEPQHRVDGGSRGTAGIGAKTAERIVQYRQKNGPFKGSRTDERAGCGREELSQVEAANHGRRNQGRPRPATAAVVRRAGASNTARPHPMAVMRHIDSRGYWLIELMFVAALLVTTGAMAIPQVTTGLDEFRAAGAARYVSTRLQRTRMEALARSVDVAMQFTRSATGYAFAVYADGNHNGVLTTEIAGGVDAGSVSSSASAINSRASTSERFRDCRRWMLAVRHRGRDPIRLGSAVSPVSPQRERQRREACTCAAGRLNTSCGSSAGPARRA